MIGFPTSENETIIRTIDGHTLGLTWGCPEKTGSEREPFQLVWHGCARLGGWAVSVLAPRFRRYPVPSYQWAALPKRDAHLESVGVSTFSRGTTTKLGMMKSSSELDGRG